MANLHGFRGVGTPRRVFGVIALMAAAFVAVPPMSRAAETELRKPVAPAVRDGVVRNASGQILMMRLEGRANWKDLEVARETQRQLQKIAETMRGRKAGEAALFAGSDGATKLRAAAVLATELRVPLYRVDVSAVVSKYIGETEKNLERIFAAAEAAGGVVLFFDEADALFGKRTNAADAHDRYANQEVSYLLARVEDFVGLAILASNHKDAPTDPVVAKRIRHVVAFTVEEAEK